MNKCNTIYGAKFDIVEENELQMKKISLAFILFSTLQIVAQDKTEIFVFDLEPVYEGLQLTNFTNISNNDGYNNQPSFSTNETILFAGNKNGQTDISEYNLINKTQKFINSKTDGSEYSPQKFALKNDVAAVRLDTDGLQRLYQYNYENGTFSELIPIVQIAYFSFYNNNTMLATVLDSDQMALVQIDFQSKKVDTILRNVGRSVHKVPKSKSMSYTAVNEDKNLDIFMLDMNNGESFFICQLPIGVQDYVWLNDTQILAGSRNKLFMFDTLGPQNWNQVASLEEFGVSNITRMAVSQNGKKIAIVGQSN